MLINLAGLEDDEEWAAATRERAERSLEKARAAADELAAAVEARLSGDT